MKYIRNNLPVFVFAVLSFIIILPLLLPGFILTIDLIPVPKIIWPEFTSQGFIFNFAYTLLSFLITVALVEKIILFFIFFLSGWGLYRLLPEKLGFARFFGGIFYAVNPFVYERVMAGQWNLLLGYAIFPFAISYVRIFLETPSRKNSILLAMMTTLLISIVIHYSLIFLTFIFLFVPIYLIFHKEKLQGILRFLPIYAIGLLLLNINWIIPIILGSSGVVQTLESFSTKDLVAFQSYPDTRYGLIFNLLSGYGFWPEAHQYFLSPKTIIIFWPVLSITFILISLYGCIRVIQERNETKPLPLVLTLCILFLIALDFAGGVGLRPFADTVFSLYQKVPILRGLREPQKLVSVIMLCYAYFGSFGLYYFKKRIDAKRAKFFLVIFLILPFIYTPTILRGFWGQLKPVVYPQSWTKVNTILNEDKDQFLVLFFPWHQYMYFRFSNYQLHANPAPSYFDKPILSSRNYETVPLYSHENRPEALHVEGLLRIEKTGTNLVGEKVEEKLPWGLSLAPIGVKYIILVKDDDWESYSYLKNSADLTITYEDNDVILFSNKSWEKI